MSLERPRMLGWRFCYQFRTDNDSPFLVFSDPEASPHPDLLDPPATQLLEPLAAPTLNSPPQAQIVYSSMRSRLGRESRSTPDAKIFRLVSLEGETRRESEGLSKQVLSFDG